LIADFELRIAEWPEQKAGLGQFQVSSFELKQKADGRRRKADVRYQTSDVTGQRSDGRKLVSFTRLSPQVTRPALPAPVRCANN